VETVEKRRERPPSILGGEGKGMGKPLERAKSTNGRPLGGKKGPFRECKFFPLQNEPERGRCGDRNPGKGVLRAVRAEAGGKKSTGTRGGLLGEKKGVSEKSNRERRRGKNNVQLGKRRGNSGITTRGERGGTILKKKGGENPYSRPGRWEEERRVWGRWSLNEKAEGEKVQTSSRGGG